ncbi:hypothetical protein [Noviherbaspirillum galbum]|uniref:Uncharacterized protein n=1 Tax=Noviherbaspirillum galbum TaxID=2709383 RepID=A0A6B3SQS7_9BURK|nr:hypothetical protein [Noviherbaspirillum galbum]NEX63117.1 hypothetical protein [Noviherbaspirillum galbum]
MKSGLIMLALVFIQAARASPPRAPDVSEVMESVAEARPGIVVIDNLTDEQRRFYWKNTRRSDAGYLLINAPYDYIRFPDAAARHARQGKSMTPLPAFAEDLLAIPPSMAPLAVFTESPHRVTLLFEHKTLGTILLTLWNVEADGAQLFLIKEFQRELFPGTSGTLSLATSPGHARVLWKMNWVKAGINHEFYVGDTLGEERRPSLSPEAVMNAAQAFLK